MASVNLCFHGIGTPQRQLEDGEDVYWITEQVFADVLDLLDGRPDVRLSFDDGNASDHAIALPALQSRGLTATFFPIADRLDQAGSLATEQLRELVAAGMDIGTHGLRHRPWRGLTDAQAEEEFVVARQRIADAVGRPITEAACPLGRYDRATLARLRRLGYSRVYTSDRARCRDESWLQPRYSLWSSDTAGSIREIVQRRPSAKQRLLDGARIAVKRLR
jgi:peptidoglycan/xylan/chitin deacetylase (PgdA/CDA1 family)